MNSATSLTSMTTTAPATSATPATSPTETVRIAAFDFDGTVLEGHSPVRLVRSLIRRRVIGVGVGLKALWWGVRYRLRLPVDQKAARGYIFASLSHVPAVEADALMAELYHDELAPLIRPAARTMLHACRQAGEKTVIVSASFRPLLEQAVAEIEADWFICTEMEVVDGSYTGQVVGQAPEGEQKAIQLRAWANANFGEGAWCLAQAFGDHHSDVPLLELAEQPFAVNPDVHLERLARKRQWQIVDWSM